MKPRRRSLAPQMGQAARPSQDGAAAELTNGRRRLHALTAQLCSPRHRPAEVTNPVSRQRQRGGVRSSGPGSIEAAPSSACAAARSRHPPTRKHLGVDVNNVRSNRTRPEWWSTSYLLRSRFITSTTTSTHDNALKRTSTSRTVGGIPRCPASPTAVEITLTMSEGQRLRGPRRRAFAGSRHCHRDRL
jgi:hypothetical protein